jgi:3-oxoacyl-[acyl-carrier protein] reductase
MSQSNPLPLTGRIAIVVGGSGGIGKATAERLAALGASVTITYRNRQDEAQVWVARLPGGNQPRNMSMSRTVPAWAGWLQPFKSRHGTAHILVGGDNHRSY